MCGYLSHPLPGTWPASQACALDWSLNQQPFDFQASTQSTEPHQPGHIHVKFCECDLYTQWQINWYVIWSRNKQILFYLHCLIFMWGFLPSFSLAVVNFCFNFCHYHKQHPLVIIWVEDSASQDFVELRLNKLLRQDTASLLFCCYFPQLGILLGYVSWYVLPMGIESHIYTSVYFW